MGMSAAEAKIDLTIMNSEALEIEQSDVVARLVNAGLPIEFITRVESLWHLTRQVTGQVIHIGRIILAEILKFIEANPNLAIGVAVGASIGALISMVPWIGPILAPLASMVGIMVGGVAGYKLDQSAIGNQHEVASMQAAIAVARKFFDLFANILCALKTYFQAEK